MKTGERPNTEFSAVHDEMTDEKYLEQLLGKLADIGANTVHVVQSDVGHLVMHGAKFRIRSFACFQRALYKFSRQSRILLPLAVNS